ncbi:unnamed protein product [Rotaria magnacalcarata]|uniref:TIR domain-containing protein n=4 Tax=Rotaria magnacalcarata TaxID=392030 RepID=A0A816QHG5_9BILA|nr:unnamed protein product [Rotaria magnacalcarata]CAF1521489.1 unnamed protein product [Rotaria magnacalcarata]CAF2060495.1 unnamed protein product [Rotaria magnacalcarata]CAF2092826.1 unnamed protein product [Rotaria magnacalcarata]CAF2192170.1 unnamed protein product [Rotaria magnacalcarata]
MAEDASNSNDYPTQISENSQPSNFDEFREMVDAVLNLDATNDTHNDETFVEEQQINQALLSSLDLCNGNEQITSLSTNTAVSVAELPSDITDSLNVAAKQLSLLYESVSNVTSTEQDGNLVENSHDIEGLNSSTVEPLSEPETAQFQASSTVPKPTAVLTANDNLQQKRHIMISYNRSSRETCQKIYEDLVKRNYKVWMDLTDMGDDILVSMARAVENSYIVLICINQQYYESEYCRLEAEYAAENRIKFIPCLMEKSFRAQSWLGIIKGSNYHIDFSAPEDFDKSFDELIRQITHVEKKLSLQPRRTPAPSSMVNPMRLAAMSATHANISSSAQNVNSRRFDAIIREYKQSIKKRRGQLTRLKKNELSDLISKLRQELFTETSQVLTDSDRSDEEDEKQNNDSQLLEHLLTRSLDQNEVLLRLVDRLTTAQPTEQTNIHNLDMNGIVKVILAIMLLWTLNLLCHKE